MLKKKKHAFTIMEMLIVVSLTVVVLGITTSIFMMGNKVFSDSNAKSTLQMEGQSIQEKMRNIGMQAISIDYCNTKNGDIKDKQFASDEFKANLVDINGNHSTSGEWIDISGLGVNSPSKNSEYDNINKVITNLSTVTINYNGNSRSLVVGSGNPISTHVKSLRIRPSNIKDATGTVGQANSIEFNIELALSNGSSSVTCPINFTITFRNKVN